MKTKSVDQVLTITSNLRDAGQRFRSLAAFRISSVHHFFVVAIFCGAALVRCTAGTFATPDCTITGLTHAFANLAPAGPASSITDSAEPGQFQVSTFTNEFTGDERVTSRFEAAPGKKFVFHAPPAGFGAIRLNLRCQWGNNSSAGITGPASTTATFENLVGPTPVFISDTSDLSPDGKRLISQQEFDVAPGTEFTGVQLSAQFATTITNPITTQVYYPSNSSLSILNARAYAFQSLPDGILMTLEPIRPNLSLELSPDGAVIVWPTNFSDWVLETTTNPGPASGWSAVTNIPAVSGTNFMIYDSVGGVGRFYRLKMP